MESKLETNQNSLANLAIKDELEKKFMKYKNERLKEKIDPLAEITINHDQQPSIQREGSYLEHFQMN